MKTIRAGVVGVGFIGAAHVEALRRIGVEIAGVLGSDPERAAAKAASIGVPKVFDDLDELLADPTIDVVHIATPNHLHASQVTRCLEAGKHVVCEKPLALTAAQAATLTRQAEAAGLINAVCFNLRFYPLNHQARAMVAAGAIGEPTLISGAYLQDWLLLDTDWNWRLVPDEAGSLRAIADIGSHWFDLTRFVSGRRIVEVMADLHTIVPVRRRPPGPVETFAAPSASDEHVDQPMTSDDAAGVLLRYEDGTRGLVTISQVSAGRKNAVTWEIDGRSGSLAWLSENPDQLVIGHRGRPNEVMYRDPSLMHPDAVRVNGYPGGHVEGYPDTFRALFAEVYADVARGGPAHHPTYPTFADGLDALLVTEAVASSSRERRWMTVDRHADANDPGGP
jgi:predicted dehydrogenase